MTMVATGFFPAADLTNCLALASREWSQPLDLTEHWVGLHGHCHLCGFLPAGDGQRNSPICASPNR